MAGKYHWLLRAQLKAECILTMLLLLLSDYGCQRPD